MENTLKEITVNYQPTTLVDSNISCSQDAEKVLRSVYLNNKSEISLKEYFYILLLNRSNKVLGYYKLSEGGITGTIADIRLAFGIALKSACSGMIMCHNHPSGNLSPSKADKELTKRFTEAGRLLDIQVLDHIIITSYHYISFADEGFI